ncbi:hypothetical protein J7G16_004187 [Vibrio parahaemolyticus]|nr:hypothetical protein [Vibrio parahaemolyticus]
MNVVLSKTVIVYTVPFINSPNIRMMNMIFMKFKNLILGMLLLSLMGCNQEQGKSAEPVSLYAQDSFNTVQAQRKAFVNLISNVESSHSGTYISDVTPLNNAMACRSFDVNKQGTVIDTGNGVGLCSFKYEVQNDYDDKAFANAYSVVAIQEKSDTTTEYFKSLSRVAVIDSPVTINLNDELGSEIPFGFDLDESSVSILGSGSEEIKVDGTLNQIQFTSSEVGVSRVMFSFTDGSVVKVGVVTIAVSDGINSLPSAENYDYPDVIDLDSTIPVDVKSLISDADGDQLQLIYVNSLSAEVVLDSASDVTNTQFSFTAHSSGVHIVTYAVSDHRGGINIAAISFKVVDPAGKSPWNDVTVDFKQFLKPLTREDAVAESADYSGLVYEKDPVSGVRTWHMTTFNVAKAEKHCKTRGHIASTEEMATLAANGSGGVNLASGWPVQTPYIVKNGSSYTAVNMDSDVPSSAALGVDGGYLTCVADMGMEIDLYETRVTDIPANGDDEAKIVVNITREGEFEEHAVVNIIPDVISTTLDIDAMTVETDFSGAATFTMRNTKAETIPFTIEYEGAELRIDVEFIGDKTTAVLFGLTATNGAAVLDSVAEVNAQVLDAFNNAVPDQAVLFEQLDLFDDASFDTLKVVTDENGIASAKLRWLNETPATESQVVPVRSKTTSPDMGTTEVETSVSFYAGTITSIDGEKTSIIKNRGSDDTAIIAVTAKKFDGSAGSFFPVTFETDSPNLGFVDGVMKEDGSGWTVTNRADLDGVARAYPYWVGAPQDPMSPNSPFDRHTITALFSSASLTQEVTAFSVGVCGGKVNGAVDYDPLVSDCLSIYQANKDDPSSPAQHWAVALPFGKVLGDLFDSADANLFPKLNWYSADLIGNERHGYSSFSSISNRLSVGILPSGYKSDDFNFVDSFEVETRHNSYYYCDFLNEIQAGGKTDWFAYNRRTGGDPDIAKSLLTNSIKFGGHVSSVSSGIYKQYFNVYEWGTTGGPAKEFKLFFLDYSGVGLRTRTSSDEGLILIQRAFPICLSKSW